MTGQPLPLVDPQSYGAVCAVIELLGGEYEDELEQLKSSDIV